MNRNLLLWCLGAAACLAFAVVAFKTRFEIESRTADRWTGANRRLADKLENEWNPGFIVPNPQDIIDGVEPVGALPKADGHAFALDQTITTTWPYEVTSNTIQTEHSRMATAQEWIEAHFASLDLARERQQRR